MPTWIYDLAIFSLITAGICALIIVVDIFTKHPQNMWIMQIVWPVTALWSGPLGLYAYYKMGRLSTKQRVQQAKQDVWLDGDRTVCAFLTRNIKAEQSSFLVDDANCHVLWFSKQLSRQLVAAESRNQGDDVIQPINLI